MFATCFTAKAETMVVKSAHPIIYFDGICALCNSFVSFVLKRDKKNLFRFSTVQEFDKQKLHSKETVQKDTIFLVTGSELFEESDAVIRILKQLGGIWRLVSVAQYVPRFLRDGMYRWIARNRFRIFGKTEYCNVMTPEVKKKFLHYKQK